MRKYKAFAILVSVTLISVTIWLANGPDYSNVGRIAISEEIDAIVHAYIRSQKHWTVDEYEIYPITQWPEPNIIEVHIMFKDDVPRWWSFRRGSNKSIWVHVDMVQKKVVKELWSQ